MRYTLRSCAASCQRFSALVFFALATSSCARDGASSTPRGSNGVSAAATRSADGGGSSGRPVIASPGPARRNAFAMTFVEISVDNAGSREDATDQVLGGDGGPDTDGDELSVTVARVPKFFIADTEVTRRQWTWVMGEGTDPSIYTSTSNGDAGDLPVNNVSWHQAVDFCYRLSHIDGRTYRLPTEMEWEAACSLGQRGAAAAASINTSGTIARVRGDSGTERPDAYGLYAMLGNVAEWTSTPTRPIDWKPADTGFVECFWSGGKLGGPDAEDVDRAKVWGAFYVVRGGFFGSQPQYCTPANRWGQPTTYIESRGNLGFRVVMDP